MTNYIDYTYNISVNRNSLLNNMFLFQKTIDNSEIFVYNISVEIIA